MTEYEEILKDVVELKYMDGSLVEFAKRVKDYLKNPYGLETSKPLLEDAAKLVWELSQRPTEQDIILAVEFGYKQCEKGQNLETAISNAKKTMENK